MIIKERKNNSNFVHAWEEDEEEEYKGQKKIKKKKKNKISRSRMKPLFSELLFAYMFE